MTLPLGTKSTQNLVTLKKEFVNSINGYLQTTLDISIKVLITI